MKPQAIFSDRKFILQSFLLLFFFTSLFGQAEADSIAISGLLPHSGNTTVIPGSELEQISSLGNISQALQGVIPGLDVVNTSYGLNTIPDIYVKGGSGSPLFVVDGMPQGISIGHLPIYDIESIEILEGPEAIALYGEQAFNGVIAINTRQGQKGPVRVNLDLSFTLSNPLRYFDQVTGGEWLDMLRDYRRAEGDYEYPFADPEADRLMLSEIANSLLPEQYAMQGYQWNSDGSVATRPVTAREFANWSEFYIYIPQEVPVYNPESVGSYDWYSHGLNRNALTQNQHLSISGGNEWLRAYFSTSFLQKEGLGVGEDFRRINPLLNLEVKALKWLSLGFHGRYSRIDSDPGEGMLTRVADMIPLSAPYDFSGNFQAYPFMKEYDFDPDHLNPLKMEEYNISKDKASAYAAIFYADFHPGKKFRNKVTISQSHSFYESGSYRNMDAYPELYTSSFGSYSSTEHKLFQVNNLMVYNTDIKNNRLKLSFYQEYRNYFSKDSLSSFPLDSYSDNLGLFENLNSNTSSLTTTNYIFSDISSISLSGMLEYVHNENIYLTGSMKYLVGRSFTQSRRGFFPALGFRWDLSNLDLIKSLDGLNALQLHLSYGRTGIIEGIRLRTNDGIRTGFDFGLFDYRLTGKFSGYLSFKEIGVLIDIPSSSGYDQLYTFTKVNVNGIQLSLTSHNISKKDFRWESSLDINYSRKILDTENFAYKPGSVNVVGEDFEEYYDFIYDGIWQPGDADQIAIYDGNMFSVSPGNIRVEDVADNQSIDYDDRTIIGHSYPDLFGSLNNKIVFRDFELSLLAIFRQGNMFYTNNYFNYLSDNANPYFLENYYRPMGFQDENTAAEFPMLPSSVHRESLWYRDASFLRIRHITLTYHIPEKISERLKMNGLSFSLQAFNPFLFTSYPYLDPEATRVEELGSASGISPRGWTFNIKASF